MDIQRYNRMGFENLKYTKNNDLDILASAVEQEI